MVMNLTETAGRLSGTFLGNAIDPVGFPVEIYDGSGLDVPALASGALSANGGAGGTFSGALHFAHPSFGIGGACIGVDIPWAITDSR